MDYVEQLKQEAHGAHSIFHQYSLQISRENLKCYFLFLEGHEDLSFYMNFIAPRLSGRQPIHFTCFGRTEVIKVSELVNNDERSLGRALFFIDKDHTDIYPANDEGLANNIFQTSVYSVENYIVCKDVFSRFWTERLHLSVADDRYEIYLDKFIKTHKSFIKRMRLITALILIGRGINGEKSKLNLNNVNLDNLFKIDIENSSCHYKKGALSSFKTASDFALRHAQPKGKELIKTYREHLARRDPKTYLRGKYELWFFCKFLNAISSMLSSKKHCPKHLPRATPKASIQFEGCLETLANFCPIPEELKSFIEQHVHP